MKKKLKSDTEKLNINKIIYFDKETIQNLLQEYNKGVKKTTVNSSTEASVGLESNVGVETKVKLGVPFWARVSFLFSSKLSANFISKFKDTTTITSTEISDFEKIKDNFTLFENISISDIENSLTFFRDAGNYLRILKGGVKEVDAKEFKSVMEGYEGYDHYKLNKYQYVRFNSLAFLSNYKRNDLLNTKLNIYCIPVGKFSKSDFNFIEQLNKMQNLTTVSKPNHTLADIYPSFDNIVRKIKRKTDDSIELFDVVYASISQGELNA